MNAILNLKVFLFFFLSRPLFFLLLSKILVCILNLLVFLFFFYLSCLSPSSLIQIVNGNKKRRFNTIQVLLWNNGAKNFDPQESVAKDTLYCDVTLGILSSPMAVLSLHLFRLVDKGTKEPVRLMFLHCPLKSFYFIIN